MAMWTCGKCKQTFHRAGGEIVILMDQHNSSRCALPASPEDVNPVTSSASDPRVDTSTTGSYSRTRVAGGTSDKTKRRKTL